MQSQAPYLLLTTASGQRQLSLAEGSCWTVGRSDDNSFPVKDRCISRHHAMLQCTDAADYYLIDLGSSNGTFVNGRRVNVPTILRNGDNVAFGQTECKFFSPRTAVEETPPSDGEMTMDGTATSILHVRKLMTIVVVDMRNFTTLTRQMDENLMSELMTTWFRNCGHIIRRYGSWVDKYIGDAVMAVWFHNVETVGNQDILSILNALNDLNHMTKLLSRQYPLPFELRIGAGVNTGYGMVGNSGSGDRPDYTALGDTVNAAFRLETSTKQINADIAVGASTYKYIAPIVPERPLFQQSSVELKGYDAPTQAYSTTFSALHSFLQSIGSHEFTVVPTQKMTDARRSSEPSGSGLSPLASTDGSK
jgi:adenylate cyclase